MARWLVFFIVLVPILTIGALVMTAEGFAPTARLHATAAADPACRAEVLAGLEMLRRDLGLLADFAPPDADAIATTGALDKTYARDGVRHCRHHADKSQATHVAANSAWRELRIRSKV